MVYFLGILYFIFGLCFGSFNNVLIYRMPNNISVFKVSRSFCPKCKHEIKWYDNIPLLSYIILGGKCRNCKERISPQYPVVELMSGLLFLLAYLMFGFSLKSVVVALLLNFGFAIFVIDAQSLTIPLSLNITMGVLGLFLLGEDLYYQIINNNMANWNIFYDKLVAFGGVIVIFVLIYLIASLLLKKEALGLGDIILFAMLSFSLGLAKLFLVVLISSITCSIISLILIASKKSKKEDLIPYGPYIIFGFYIAIIFGDNIINGILSFMGF